MGSWGKVSALSGLCPRLFRAFRLPGRFRGIPRPCLRLAAAKILPEGRGQPFLTRWGRLGRGFALLFHAGKNW